jgi:hypothetical protein
VRAFETRWRCVRKFACELIFITLAV